ncbi:MAG: type II toxin-antitoxin system RelE/ParE family toxin [Rhizobiaceae bacterium]
MKRRKVIIAPEAEADLLDIESWLIGNASMRTAEAFVLRIIEFCGTLDIASERGHSRDDVKEGIRIVGFERRVTIAFAVHDDRVDILRIFRAGRDWEAAFDEE